MEVVVHLSDSFSVARSVNLLEGLHESHKKHHKTVYFLTVFGGSSYADTLGCAQFPFAASYMGSGWRRY